MIKRREKVKGIIMLLMASVFWGSSFAVVKDSLDYVTPMWQLFFRLFVAVVIMAVIFQGKIRKLTKKQIAFGIKAGAAITLALCFQNEGCNLTTAGKSSFLTCCYVAFVPVLALVWKRIKNPLQKYAAAVICIAGIGFITLEQGLTINFGDILTLICAVFYAVHIIVVEDTPEEMSPVMVQFLQMTTACVMSLVMAFVLEPLPEIGGMGNRAWFSIVYCGIFEVMIGFLLQIEGQMRTSATLTALLTSLESVFGCVFSALLLGEEFSLKMVIGCVLIFISVLVSELPFERFMPSKYFNVTDKTGKVPILRKG